MFDRSCHLIECLFRPQQRQRAFQSVGRNGSLQGWAWKTPQGFRRLCFVARPARIVNALPYTATGLAPKPAHRQKSTAIARVATRKAPYVAPPAHPLGICLHLPDISPHYHIWVRQPLGALPPTPLGGGAYIVSFFYFFFSCNKLPAR